MKLNPQVFREYDVRGFVDTDLSDEFAYHLGRAYAALVKGKGNPALPVAVGHAFTWYVPSCNSRIRSSVLLVSCTESDASAELSGLYIVTDQVCAAAWVVSSLIVCLALPVKGNVAQLGAESDTVTVAPEPMSSDCAEA